MLPCRYDYIVYDLVVVVRFLTVLMQCAGNARIRFPFVAETPRSSRALRIMLRKTQNERRSCTRSDLHTLRQSDVPKRCISSLHFPVLSTTSVHYYQHVDATSDLSRKTYFYSRMNNSSMKMGSKIRITFVALREQIFIIYYYIELIINRMERCRR